MNGAQEIAIIEFAEVGLLGVEIARHLVGVFRMPDFVRALNPQKSTTSPQQQLAKFQFAWLVILLAFHWSVLACMAHAIRDESSPCSIERVLRSLIVAIFTIARSVSPA